MSEPEIPSFSGVGELKGAVTQLWRDDPAQASLSSPATAAGLRAVELSSARKRDCRSSAAIAVGDGGALQR